MPSFSGATYRTPFGKNVYLRSTQDVKTESFTVAKSTIPAVTIDGAADQKVLQPGTWLAKITSGGDVGKVGPYQSGSGNEVQSLVTTGTPTGGTFTLEFAGDVTDPIAHNASAATVQAALEALPSVNAGDIVATGGALPTAVTLTFSGPQFAGLSVGRIQVDNNGLTGGTTPTAVVTVTTEGGATPGAADGRQNPENIVGLNNTFLPWQLMERDVEVAVVYQAAVVIASTFKLNAAGTAFVAGTVADAVLANRNVGVEILAR